VVYGPHHQHYSILLGKVGFADDICMYKKCARHDKDAEPANNDEEQFAT
jgi:hypothetical protein